MILRRLGSGLLDQILSSLSNIVFILALARVSSVEAFGALSFAYAVCTFGMGLQRAATGPLISLSRNVRCHPTLLCVLWGAIISFAGYLLITVILGTPPRLATVLLLANSIAAFPQDSLRYQSIAGQRTYAAILSDGFWCIASILLVLLAGPLRLGPTETVVLYNLSTVVALLMLLFVLKPGWGSPVSWLLLHFSELKSLVPDALLATAVPLAITASVAAHFSLADVGGMRGGGTLLGPVSLLMSAIPLVLLGEMSRANGRERLRISLAQTTVMGVFVIACGSIVWLLPDRTGVALLGGAWESAHGLIPFIALDMFFFALASGPILFLRTGRHWQSILKARLTYAGIVLAILLAGRSFASIEAFLASLAFASFANFGFVALAAWNLRSGAESSR